MKAAVRRYPTCQTCGRWFRSPAGARLHLLAFRSHGPVR